MIVSLFLSQGVPLFLGGDEFGRTQNGNNNAYCQDNETSWYDWERMDWSMVAFVQKLTAIRRSHPSMRRVELPTGRVGPDGRRDIVWFTAVGSEITEADWRSEFARTLAALIAQPESDGRGDEFYLVFNASADSMKFTLPPGNWETLLTTGAGLIDSNQIQTESFTVAVLQRLAP